MYHYLKYIIALVGLVLFGCTSTQTTSAVLPLADNQPTLLLFYTDN